MKNIHIHKATPEEANTMIATMKELYRLSYLNAYKVIIVGECDFNDYEYMTEKLNELFWISDIFHEYPIKLISGIANDADTLAIRYADEHCMTKILFPANWKEHPHAADILRNEDMLTIATHLVAFWNGKSHEIKHMIEMAYKKEIPVWIFKYETEKVQT